MGKGRCAACWSRRSTACWSTGARAELLFGEAEVLVPAKHLVGQAEVTRALPEEGVTYIHILFDRHEIVQSDGIWTESFQPAERTLSAMEAGCGTKSWRFSPSLPPIPGAYDGGAAVAEGA